MEKKFLSLKAAEFRKRAENCRAMAAKMTNPKAIAELDAAAKGWAELADQHAAVEPEVASG